jgi:hypothetical protein
MKLFAILAALLVLAACQPQEPSNLADNIARPTYELATTEAYDFASIQPYAADHSAVYDYIDAHLEQHVGALQRWVRQPSISAQNVGIQEMAEMLRQDLSDLGFAEAELVPTDGHPGVWGYYDAGAEKTLVLYLMYDVQPVNPEDWDSPPFEAQIIDHSLGRVLRDHRPRTRPGAHGKGCNQPERSAARISQCARIDHRGRGQFAREYHGGS